MHNVITQEALTRRAHWVEEIRRLSGNFGDDTDRLKLALEADIQRGGAGALLDHLRLCGDIPESYGHDSSEEKLYSKYTDTLIAQAFRFVGLKSLVLTTRADVADVEVFAQTYSFIADGKAFRLSRTAKNQKDFKVQAMHRWKHGKDYAMVVCPIYQLPTKSSQIYLQASASNVCLFTYSHLAVLISFSLLEGEQRTEALIHEIFKVIPTLNPSKDAAAYWLPLNRTMLAFSSRISDLWQQEKQASVESIAAAKAEGLAFLAQERERIMRMSHDEAVAALLKVHKIENRIAVIQTISDNRLLDIR